MVKVEGATLRRQWCEELVEGEGMGNFKRTKFDGHLDRVKDALKVFVAHSLPRKKREVGGGGEKSSKKKG
ncbi:hypothetical protein ACHAWC_010484 [Mediolabrus comicus]